MRKGLFVFLYNAESNERGCELNAVIDEKAQQLDPIKLVHATVEAYAVDNNEFYMFKRRCDFFLQIGIENTTSHFRDCRMKRYAIHRHAEKEELKWAPTLVAYHPVSHRTNQNFGMLRSLEDAEAHSASKKEDASFQESTWSFRENRSSIVIRGDFTEHSSGEDPPGDQDHNDDVYDNTKSHMFDVKRETFIVNMSLTKPVSEGSHGLGRWIFLQKNSH